MRGCACSGRWSRIATPTGPHGRETRSGKPGSTITTPRARNSRPNWSRPLRPAWPAASSSRCSRRRPPAPPRSRARGLPRQPARRRRRPPRTRPRRKTRPATTCGRNGWRSSRQRLTTPCTARCSATARRSLTTCYPTAATSRRATRSTTPSRGWSAPTSSSGSCSRRSSRRRA
ncbi:hypothetical protein D3C71_923120 [compost metagenome]